MSPTLSTRGASAGFAVVLIDEGEDDLDDLLLLSAWEFSNGFEGALDLAERTWGGGERGRDRSRGGLAEDVLDTNAEGLGHLGEDVGARRFVGVLPEGDVGLDLANEVSEFGLGKAGGFTEGE